jgi:hypothetical protein
MAEPQDEIFEPQSIDEFSRDARVLEAVAFRARYGEGFLIHHGPLQPERRVKQPQRTLVIDPSQAPAEPMRGPLPSSELRVYAVRNTGRSPYPRIITVGRTRNNDVVLPDIVISKFHAFFKEEDHTFFLSDADSRNGTFVDGKPVPSTKQGKAVSVNPGAKVRFGMIELWFVDAAGLAELVRQSVP